MHSQLGHPVPLLQPSLDLITRIKRNTQIIYPKDAAYLVRRACAAGSVIEQVGTGSGGLTIASLRGSPRLAGPTPYEVRADNYQIARTNLSG